MKTKNLKINKKRLCALIIAASLLVGGGIALSHNLASRNNSNKKTIKSEVQSVPFTYYYQTGDYVFVSNGETIGYVNKEKIDFSNINLQNYHVDFSDMVINDDNAMIYKLPDDSKESSYVLKKGDKVTLNAYAADSFHASSWSVIQYFDENSNLQVGFIKSSCLSKPEVLEPVATQEPVEEKPKISIAVITGDRVNVRSSMEKGTNNRLGYANTGDKFTIIDEIGGWYLIDFYGKEGYIDKSYATIEEINQEDLQTTVSSSEIIVARITGNNVNVRSSTNTKSDDNIIGFCDISDKFEIIEKLGDWYKIKYLGNVGYINAKYVREVTVDREEFNIQKMVALSKSSPFYGENGNYLCNLPINQNLLVIGEKDNKYKVLVDGVVGYVNKSDTKKLTKRTLVVDLSRQIVKVYHNGIEVFRASGITGAKGMETERGCFTIGHHMIDYTFPSKKIRNEVWIQFDGNRGFHPADANYGKGWQKPEYFKEVREAAYERWANGKGNDFPCAHGSHGCFNMRLVDVLVLYDLCDIGDNVLVIGQNDLIKFNLIGSTDTFDIISDSNSNLYFVAKSTGAIITMPNIEESGKYVNNSINDDIPKIKTLV